MQAHFALKSPRFFFSIPLFQDGAAKFPNERGEKKVNKICCGEFQFMAFVT